MKSFILALALLWQAFPAHAGDREQLIGMWVETHPRDHIVHFAEDGSWKLHLKKNELADYHSLEGTWTISPDGKLRVTLHLNGKTQIFSTRMKFNGEELLLVDDNGTETRHRRHQGALPERFQW